jgi:hypothetical protein
MSGAINGSNIVDPYGPAAPQTLTGGSAGTGTSVTSTPMEPVAEVGSAIPIPAVSLPVNAITSPLVFGNPTVDVGSLLQSSPVTATSPTATGATYDPSNNVAVDPASLLGPSSATSVNPTGQSNDFVNSTGTPTYTAGYGGTGGYGGSGGSGYTTGYGGAIPVAPTVATPAPTSWSTKAIATFVQTHWKDLVILVVAVLVLYFIARTHVFRSSIEKAEHIL